MRVHQRIWKYLYRHRQSRPLKRSQAVTALALLISSTLATPITAPREVHATCRSAQTIILPQGASTCRALPSPAAAQPTRPARSAINRTINRPRRPTPGPSSAPAHSLPSPTPTQARPAPSSSSPAPPAPPVPPQPAGSLSGQRTSPHGARAGALTVNVFPQGQCTWWANQRYFQLHGTYVPWRTGADAWQWVARAYEYHWHVSLAPVPGSIIVLQPGVEGAYGLGHVAVVEKLLGKGRVLASTMNWGTTPWKVQYVVYNAGPGVAFIYA